MSKLEEFQSKFDSEIKINKYEHGTDLHVEALKTNDLLVSWVNFYIKEKNILKKLYNKRNRLFQELKLYYSGKASPEVYNEKPLNERILRSDLESYINSNDTFLQLKEQIDEQESVVELCQLAVETLKTRTFLIKDAIKYLEFINGL